MSAIGKTGIFQNQPNPLRAYESIIEDGIAYEIPNFTTGIDVGNLQNPQLSTANKTTQLYCSKCRNLIDDLPRILSPTTQLPFYETVDPNYECPIVAVNTPLKFAEELLKRLGDSNLLSSLIQYYLDYQASVKATLLESTATQAWESKQYDMTPVRSSRRELPFVPNRLNAEWSKDVYETDVDAPHAEHSPWNQDLYNTDDTKTDDPRIKIFPCGHIYHYHCVADMSDCSHAPTCKKAAELFYHRVLVLNFNPDLLPGSQAELLNGLGFSKPSLANRCVGNLRARLWGAGSITNLSDWARFRGRRALVLVAAVATVAVPVLMTLLSKSSAPHGGAEEGSPENTTVTADMLNATVFSVANTTISTLGLTSVTAANIANATMTALGIINATRTVLDIINTTFAPSNTAATSTPQNTQPMTTPSAAQLSFAAEVSYVVATGPWGIVTGDFNRDSKPDLAVTNFNSNDVAVSLGVGDGTFQAVVKYVTGNNPIGLTAHDLNRDGKTDLALANYGSNTVSVLLGGGDGSFQSIGNYPVGESPYYITARDFNRDGKPDLAVTSGVPNTVSILLGNGDGSFQSAVTYGVGSFPEGITAGDFNGDGKIDLAVTNRDSNNISVMLGAGDGTFQVAVNYPVGSSPEGITTDDFNEDGKLDLAVTSLGSNNVAVLLGNGNGTFQAAVNYDVGSIAGQYTVGIMASDLNRDGKADLALANYGSNTVSILPGKGDGTFQTAVNYGVGTNPISIVANDFNRDGKPDFAVTNAGSTTVSVLLNSEIINASTPLFGKGVSYNADGYPNGIVTGDFNRDGKLDLALSCGLGGASILLGKGDGTFLAATSYGAGSIPSAITAGDFNRDGKLDLAVTNWETTNLAVLLGAGDGTFQTAVNYGVGFDPIDIVTGDFNRDGKLDLAVGHYGASYASILLGKGDGTFQAAINRVFTNVAYGIATDDFNMDGKPDLAISGWSVDGSIANTIWVSLGAGDGTFQTATGYVVGYNPAKISTGDFNGDGKPDLATTNYGNGVSNSISILLGAGNGAFQAALNYEVGTGPLGMTGADFNGDGKQDLVATNFGSYNGNSISTLLGNGDGSFQTAVNYEVGDGPRAVAAGDFNGDGKPDLAVADANLNNVTVLLNLG